MKRATVFLPLLLLAVAAGQSPPQLNLPAQPPQLFQRPEKTGIGTGATKCTPLFVRSDTQVEDAAYPLVTDPDAYDVYVSVLQSLTLRRPDEHLLVIVSETTARVGCCEAASTTTEWKDSLANFIDLNKGTWKLQSQLIPKQYHLISQRDVNSMFRMPPKSAGHKKQREATFAGWSQFRTQHPTSGGLIRLSAVGFDATRNRAIVYVEGVCGHQCGHGGLHYFERDANGWHESKSGGPWCAWIA